MSMCVRGVCEYVHTWCVGVVCVGGVCACLCVCCHVSVRVHVHVDVCVCVCGVHVRGCVWVCGCACVWGRYGEQRKSNTETVRKRDYKYTARLYYTHTGSIEQYHH